MKAHHIIGNSNLSTPQGIEISLQQFKKYFRTSKIKELTKPYQQAVITGNDHQQDQIKKYKTPWFSFSQFTNDHPSNKNFIQTSILVYDLDDITPEQTEGMINRLQADERILFCYRTLKGYRIRFGIQLTEPIQDEKSYRANYLHYLDLFNQEYGINLDRTADPARRFLFSYDPDLYFNELCRPVEVIAPTPESTQATPQATTPESGIFAPLPQGNRTDGLMKRGGQLLKKGLSITDVIDMVKQINLVSCSPVLSEKEIDSICKSLANYSNNSKSIKDNQIEEFLNTNQIILESMDKPTELKPIIYFQDIPVLFQNSINSISGFSGTHKSRLTEHLIGLLLRDDTEPLKLGFSKVPADYEIILIDSERHLSSQLSTAVKRILDHADLDQIPDNLKVYSLLDIDQGTRRECLETAIDKPVKGNNHKIIIIDVITDLLSDINSQIEASELMNYLNGLIKNHNCTFLLIIHENEKGLSAGHITGSIGTWISRKATNRFSIKKDDSSFTLSFEKTRLTEPIKPVKFEFDQYLNELVLIGETSKPENTRKAPLRDIEPFLLNLFRNYDELWAGDLYSIVDAEFGIKNRITIKNRIDDLNRNNSFIQISKTRKDRKLYYIVSSNLNYTDSNPDCAPLNFDEDIISGN